MKNKLSNIIIIALVCCWSITYLIQISFGQGEVKPIHFDHLTIFKNNLANPYSLADASVMLVFVDKDNQTWVGTRDNGLDYWDKTNQQFTHYRHEPTDSLSLSNDEVRAIFQDHQGELWIGTEGGGLNRWLGNGQFERLQEKDGLIANSIIGITEDQL